jgi:hypothetical protein
MALQAGTGVCDVSPPGATFLCGYPHAERLSTGIHDPLLASALCLRNGTATVVLVAVDILFLSPEFAREVRRAVANRVGTPESQVFISCSHTHSGPVTVDVLEWGPSPAVPRADPAYLARLRQGILDAAAGAAGTVQPAEIAWTTARAEGVGGNRHDPAGPSDPEVSILAVRRTPGHEWLALALVYSMHPTVLHEDSTLVSADFPSYTRQHLREALGDPLTVLYHTGPAGNQSPRHHVRGQTFAEAERLGRRLGEAVRASLGALPPEAFRDDVALDGRLASLSLPRRTLPTMADAEATLARCRRRFEELRQAGAGHGPVRTAECDLFGAEEAVFLARCQADGRLEAALRHYDPAEVQAVRIGDACLTGFPGELFVEFGLEAKRRSSGRVVPVTLVNGELQGYIVTPGAIAAGCYEANNRVFAAEAGEVLVDRALDLASVLRTGRPAGAAWRPARYWQDVQGTVRDRFWVFCCAPNTDFRSLQRRSVMSPAEAAYYLDVPNLIMVQSSAGEAQYGRLDAPFEPYALALRPLRRLSWSVVGSGGFTDPAETAAVLELARRTPNLTAIMLDDFFKVKGSPERAVLSVDEVRDLRRRMDQTGKRLDLQVTYYYRHFLDLPLTDYLELVDVVTLWGSAADLPHLDETLAWVEERLPGKRLMLGCYLFDFGAREPLPVALAEHQCETGLRWLHAGRIEGMIFLANTVADFGFPSVEWTRDWIAAVGDQPLNT